MAFHTNTGQSTAGSGNNGRVADQTVEMSDPACGAVKVSDWQWVQSDGSFGAGFSEGDSEADPDSGQQVSVRTVSAVADDGQGHRFSVAAATRTQASSLRSRLDSKALTDALYVAGWITGHQFAGMSFSTRQGDCLRASQIERWRWRVTGAESVLPGEAAAASRPHDDSPVGGENHVLVPLFFVNVTVMGIGPVDMTSDRVENRHTITRFEYLDPKDLGGLTLAEQPPSLARNGKWIPVSRTR